MKFWNNLPGSIKSIVIVATLLIGFGICASFAEDYVNLFNIRTDKNHSHYTVTWPNKISETYCVKSPYEVRGGSQGPYKFYLVNGETVVISNGTFKKDLEAVCPLK